MTTADVPNLASRRPVLTAELGVSTSTHVGRVLFDDFLPELRGRRALQVWDEMARNDATVASILYAINVLGREVDWHVEPGGESPGEAAGAEFLTEQMASLAHPWADFVGEALTGLTFGFSFHEIVYKSDDGRWGWERFANRPQTSLIQWRLDEHNRPVMFNQSVPGRTPVDIPLPYKGIHFRMDTSTPSGTPILRGAYRSWHFKKRAEEALAIGLQRNLAGLPKADVPLSLFEQGESNATFAEIKKIVTRTKVDEQMGLIWPSDTDDDGNKLYDFNLLAPGGDPRFQQVVGVIRMHAMDIASTVMAQWIGLGRDAIGSRALAEPQQELFQASLEAVLDQLEETLNRQAVKYLFDLNPGVVPEGGLLPRLRHGDLRDVDLEGIASFVLRTGQAGAQWFTEDPEDDPTMTQMRELVGLDSEDIGAVAKGNGARKDSSYGW